MVLNRILKFFHAWLKWQTLLQQSFLFLLYYFTLRFSLNLVWVAEWDRLVVVKDRCLQLIIKTFLFLKWIANVFQNQVGCRRSRLSLEMPTHIPVRIPWILLFEIITLHSLLLGWGVPTRLNWRKVFKMIIIQWKWLYKLLLLLGNFNR